MKRIFFTALLLSLIGLLNISAQERIYTPTLNLPVNGAINQMPDVVLDWNPVTGGNTGIIQYDVQLGTDPSFTDPQNFMTEFLTGYKTTNLMFGQTYYWRVRAKDGGEISGWSETWSFRVIRRVNLANPTEGSTQNDTVRVKWNTVSGLTEYDYQYDTAYFWKAMASNQTANLFATAVVDANHAWAVGAGGLVLFYDGTSWIEQESNLSTDLLSVSFVDANNGWAAGKSGKIIYFNGTSWETQESGTTKDLAGINMADDGNGWAVGKDGVVLYYNGTEWANQYTASKDLNKVFAFDATHVWAVGKSGLIIFYNGTSWAEQVTGVSGEFLSVGFTSADQGWAVGKAGLMMRLVDGAWKALEPKLVTKDLNSVYFSGPDNGYAVGATGTMLQYDGIDWYIQSSASATNLSGVAMNGTTGFLTGESGTLIKYNENAFSSPMAIIHHVNGDLTSAKITELLFGTQYFWRVRGKHSQAQAEWSGARSFITRSGVQLDKPVDNAVNQSLDQLLNWKNQMSPMVSYEIQLDDDPTYSSPVLMATTETKVTAELLKFGVQYYWRVRALHAFDTSDWSASWKFTTINTVTLLTPANDATDVKLSPLLTWEPQTGITGFQVMMSTTNSFDDPLLNEIGPGNSSSFSVPLVLEKDAIYYWRMRAINGLDTSGWSSTWSFRTMPPVGINEQVSSDIINLYPNPAENTVYIQLKEKLNLSFQLTLTDLVGKKVIEKEIILDPGNKTTQLDVSGLQNGIYMLRVADKENIFTKKLIIKR